MDTVSIFKWLGYILSIATLLFGFMLFYSDTQEWGKSLAAALISGILVLVSFLMLSWLLQVFLK